MELRMWLVFATVLLAAVHSAEADKESKNKTEHTTSTATVSTIKQKRQNLQLPPSPTAPTPQQLNNVSKPLSQGPNGFIMKEVIMYLTPSQIRSLQNGEGFLRVHHQPPHQESTKLHPVDKINHQNTLHDEAQLLQKEIDKMEAERKHRVLEEAVANSPVNSATSTLPQQAKVGSLPHSQAPKNPLLEQLKGEVKHYAEHQNQEASHTIQTLQHKPASEYPKLQPTSYNFPQLQHHVELKQFLESQLQPEPQFQREFHTPQHFQFQNQGQQLRPAPLLQLVPQHPQQQVFLNREQIRQPPLLYLLPQIKPIEHKHLPLNHAEQHSDEQKLLLLPDRYPFQHVSFNDFKLLPYEYGPENELEAKRILLTSLEKQLEQFRLKTHQLGESGDQHVAAQQQLEAVSQLTAQQFQPSNHHHSNNEDQLRAEHEWLIQQLRAALEAQLEEVHKSGGSHNLAAHKLAEAHQLANTHQLEQAHKQAEEHHRLEQAYKQAEAQQAADAYAVDKANNRLHQLGKAHQLQQAHQLEQAYKQAEEKQLNDAYEFDQAHKQALKFANAYQLEQAHRLEQAYKYAEAQQLEQAHKLAQESQLAQAHRLAEAYQLAEAQQPEKTQVYQSAKTQTQLQEVSNLAHQLSEQLPQPLEIKSDYQLPEPLPQPLALKSDFERPLFEPATQFNTQPLKLTEFITPEDQLKEIKEAQKQKQKIQHEEKEAEKLDAELQAEELKVEDLKEEQHYLQFIRAFDSKKPTSLYSILNPLVNHQNIIETLKEPSNFKPPLLEKGFKPIKEYIPKENKEKYIKEIEKILLENQIDKQNALAQAAAIASSPPVVVKEEIVKHVKIPVPAPYVVRYPEPFEVKVPQPYPVPLEIVRHVPFPIVKVEKVEVEKPVPVEVEKRVPYTVNKTVYVKVDKPYVVKKFVPVEVKKEVPVEIPVRNKSQKLSIIKHVWD